MSSTYFIERSIPAIEIMRVGVVGHSLIRFVVRDNFAVFVGGMIHLSIVRICFQVLNIW